MYSPYPIYSPYPGGSFLNIWRALARPAAPWRRYAPVNIDTSEHLQFAHQSTSNCTSNYTWSACVFGCAFLLCIWCTEGCTAVMYFWCAIHLMYYIKFIWCTLRHSNWQILELWCAHQSTSKAQQKIWCAHQSTSKAHQNIWCACLMCARTFDVQFDVI